MGIKIDQMTLEQLNAYKASIEAYGTSKELYEVETIIRELKAT